MFTLIAASALLLAAITCYDSPSTLAIDGQRSKQPQKPSEVRYVSPLHPEVESKTTGACWKCKMTLVKKRIVKTG
jgi:hypothetical protein